jgi:6-pyruvoyltetrahydropterin/6-carboxytetrahydropterin synthase
MYQLSIEKTISAAHNLRDYKGPCTRVHGHNWKIRVQVKTARLDEAGIAIDFDELDKTTWQIIQRFDHQNLNDISPFDKLNPTAENIVKYFYDQIKNILPSGVHLDKVTLWENDSYQVSYAEE